ncbi:MAG TPA: serine hydrolase [Pyrinomonadaceae bacterium]|jgi:CubicO group peptidase (beta-lactamase class C family)|nr:serine hydrolase [Pyrinomonadaceae bacterium]
MTLSCCAFAATAQTNPNDADATEVERERLVRLEGELGALRDALRIPGMSAALARDGRVVWSKGFGFADYERLVAATPDTPYVIASLTKPFASVLLMQLVEQGGVRLGDPMSKYSARFTDDSVKVRHVLTHTSEGTPGEKYRYNGSRFAALTDVIAKASGKTFRALLVSNILEKLGMNDTVPGHEVLDKRDAISAALGAQTVGRYLRVLDRLAKPYVLYRPDRVGLSAYPSRQLSAAAGLISTVNDLAKFYDAIDRDALLKRETQGLIFTPAVSTAGKTLPYGLGWFVQTRGGAKLHWHYGYWPNSFSSLVVKVPGKGLTFILLANSDALSSPFDGLGEGDVTRSAFASAFLRTFVSEDDYRRALPAPDWRLGRKEFEGDVSRLKKTAGGYGYDDESAAHKAILKWRANRPAERVVVKVDPKVYDAYAGQYTLPPLAVINVTRDGDRLMGEIVGQGTAQLLPESETSFFLKELDARVTFFKDAAGNVTHIDINLNGQKMQARKVK